MSGMTEEQLKEALEHDEATKRASQADQPSVKITEELYVALDLEAACMAKATALAATKVVNDCIGGVTANIVHKIDPDKVDVMLHTAERLTKLANLLDTLGDKGFVRYQGSEKSRV